MVLIHYFITHYFIRHSAKISIFPFSQPQRTNQPTNPGKQPRYIFSKSALITYIIYSASTATYIRNNKTCVLISSHLRTSFSARISPQLPSPVYKARFSLLKQFIHKDARQTHHIVKLAPSNLLTFSQQLNPPRSQKKSLKK